MVNALLARKIDPNILTPALTGREAAEARAPGAGRWGRRRDAVLARLR